MATKKEVWKKEKDEMKFIGYLPTEDVVGYSEYSAKISEIITQLGGKANAFGVGGTGLTFNNNTITIDTNVIAAKSYVDDNYVGNAVYEQDKDDMQHGINNLDTRTTSAESSIASLTSAVNDRYTKGETDGKLDEKLSIITSTSKYVFEGNGQHQFCKIATITATSPWANRPIVFECIGRGMSSRQIISIEPSGSQATTATTFTNITKTTNDLVWALKDEGSGVGSLYVMLAETWGNVQVLRVSYYAYVNVEMKMEACDGFPDGAVSAKNIITALYADNASKATTADTATKADTLHIPTISVGADPSAFPSQNKVNFNEIGNGSWIGGLGYPWWHIMTMQGEDTNYFTQIAVMMAYGDTPQLAFRNKAGEGSWAVAISNRTIGQQTVKDFTATEIGHGCKFNGDLQSTTLVYSPKMTTIGGLPVSDGNSPEAEKTITGARTIRFGTATFSLDFKRNAFMDYFFDHGYHIDNETEASTFYEDVGIVVYNLKTYLCTFKYYSNTGSTDFTAKQILTAGELDNLSLTGFDFADGEFTSKDTYSFKLPAKNGTIATLADIPNITQIKVENTLTSTSLVNALSAYQGKVLNDKINKCQPELNSSTGATMQWLSFKNGSSYSISGIWCTKVEMTIEGSVGNQANANFTVDTTYQSSFSNGTWYFVAMPSSGGYINTLSWGLESNSSNTGGVLYALRVYSGVKTTYKFNVIGIRLY